jgi:hypothetical protein
MYTCVLKKSLWITRLLSVREALLATMSFKIVLEQKFTDQASAMSFANAANMANLCVGCFTYDLVRSVPSAISVCLDLKCMRVVGL